MLLSDEVIGLHISTENDGRERLQELWKEKVEKPARCAGSAVPSLVIVDSPYRRVHQPVLEFVNRVKEQKADRLIAVIIPELVEPHWYEYLLHTWNSARLRALLYQQRDERTIVINTPWYLRDA